MALSSSSSSSSAPLPAADYEVFLSFRGPDVRTSFADILYQFLNSFNIRTFLDDEELPKGGDIGGNLFKYIEDSKVLIPILSPDYASSSWCLKELAHMVECCRKQDQLNTENNDVNGPRSLILPVFYMVEPRDVRHQNESYAEAFEKHSTEYDAETIKQWKDALVAVGKLKGWHVTMSQPQGAAAREVYSCARSQLMKNYLLVTKKLVGIKHHVEQVIKCLNQGVQVVGIVGMGGLGKTTMAMAVRDEVYTKFSYCCFLSNVRVTLLEKGGILALQKKIISTISGHEENILDESQGIRMIKDRVSKHKALIIIDDVDETFEFGDIFGNLEDFSSESRFIITTRDKRVFQSFQQEEVYEPNEMDLKHSLQLFSKHAFGFDYPPKGWVKMSEEFVKVATHLPLALKVIGATLHRKKEGFWNARLDKLRKIPLAEVQMRLMTSYSDLSEEEKQIFLDIACNFIGEDKEHPFHMWRNCDFFPDDGVDTLIFKSLLKIDERNKFWMHDSIRELGRGIVRKEDPRRPWRRSRIWTNEDALKMVTYEEETDQLEIFSVRFEYDTFKLTKRKFDKMSKLRYLKVYGGNFEENFESNLPNLRWLQLIGCHSLPNDMNLKGLVLFQLEKCGGVTDDWSGWAKIKGAHNLKAMDIGNCPGLRKVPDLSRCRNLELLNIKGIFMEAQKLPTSLKRLYLSSLYISNLVHLINLEKLYISDYEHSFPWDMWKLSRLKSIKLMSFRPQSLLQDSGSSRLPSSLIKLHIRYAAMERLPNLDNLNSLTKLVLWNTEVIEIPGLAGLRMLESLEIKGARQLMHLQGLEQLKLIEVLIVGTCQVLETLPSLRNLTKIHRLWIYGCKHLTEVTGFENLKKLKWLMIDERLIPSSLDRTQVNINREYDALC